MKSIKFQGGAYEEFIEWASSNKEIFGRIDAILKDISRGLGKPEPLKHDYKGYWSRRITDEHRLIYKVENDTIFVVKCKGHYQDK